MAASSITYLPNHQIDYQKWDACISNAQNGLIYAYSYFLDHMAENWDGLILNDYEAVMPLPWKKKWGIKYLYTPYFISQLGIFGNFLVSSELSVQFIRSIPDFFSYADLCFNEQNIIENSKDYKITKRTNFILSLDTTYEQIFSRYSKEAKKNLRQADYYKLLLEENITAQEIVKMYKSAYGKLSKITESDYLNVEKLINYSVSTGKGMTFCVKNAEGEICASSFFGIDNKRVYYLIGAPTDKGRKLQATSFMISGIMKKYSGTELIFDFEGSDLPNVATFYKKFSPQKKEYVNITFNNLPLLIKWIK